MSSRGLIPQTPAAPVWRQFSFFDLSPITDPQDLGQAPEGIRSLSLPYILIAPSPSSPLASSIAAIASQANGDIVLLDHRFGTIKRFKGWESGTLDGAPTGDSDKGKGKVGQSGTSRHKEKGVMLLECGGVLLGIGEDDSPSQHPILKIWDLMHEDKKTREPLLMRNIRIGSGGRGFSVSSMSTTSNLAYLAIGLISGQVLLYRHLSQSLLTSPLALTSFPKPRIVMEGTMAEPVTGLGFREPQAAKVDGVNGDMAKGEKSTTATSNGSTERTSLFVTTPNKTFVIPTIAGKASDPVLLEDLGAGIGCSTISSNKRDLIVGRDDGIYIYSLEGRGPVFAYEGEKSELKLYKDSVVIVSPPFAPSAGSQSATVRRAAASAAAASAAASGLSNAAKVTVFDLVNKFVAYSGVFKEGVRDVFSDGDGTVFVVGGDGKASRLVEQSISTKLDVLHRKSLYQLSVQIAKSAGMSEAEIADIYAKYGDHLYGKGDFDGAMTQFVKTLGSVQPSYVIRKFLDGQRIHNLTTYLQELHSRGLANADHTTLLLNCYTKTADKARLDQFIKTETSRSDKDAELPFDLETAIRVCRQAGFYEHAVYLAKRYGRHEDYLRIQLEDAGDFADALAYIRQLDPKMAEQNLINYGKQMLKHQPEATTDLLIDLCTGSLLRKRKRTVEASGRAKAIAIAERAPAGTPAYLSYLGYDQVVGLMGVSAPEKSADQATLGVNGKDAELSRSAPNGSAGTAPVPVDDSDTVYTPPFTRPFFPHFIDHPQQFIHFLETVAEQRWGHSLDDTPRRKNSHLHSPPIAIAPTANDDTAAEKDQRAIWNTLFELYLADAVRSENATAKRSHEKAIDVLLQADQLPLDPMHALILCSTNNFTAGLVRLWEKLGMYEDVLRFWMAQREDDGVTGRAPSENVVYHLNVYGPNNARLYPLVLRYLSSSNALLGRHAKDLRDILHIIDEERIMPALSVVQLLSRNGVTSIGVVKDWLLAKVAETKQDVESDKQLVASYRSETADKLKEIGELSDPSRPQVFQVTKCASCGGQLDLPSVHFMCKHSYHQRCLPDSDPECPACARQFAVIREVRRNQQAVAERHDLFLTEVEEAQDGFAVVAGAFGRGLFSKQVRDVPS